MTKNYVRDTLRRKRKKKARADSPYQLTSTVAFFYLAERKKTYLANAHIYFCYLFIFLVEFLNEYWISFKTGKKTKNTRRR